VREALARLRHDHAWVVSRDAGVEVDEGEHAQLGIAATAHRSLLHLMVRTNELPGTSCMDGTAAR